MTKYITLRTTAMNEDDFRGISGGNVTIFEPEPCPIDTGVLDANGVRIYRVEDRDPIGFRIRG